MLGRIWRWATAPPSTDHPSPVGGFASILLPYRRLVLLVAIIAIPTLILVSLLT